MSFPPNTFLDPHGGGTGGMDIPPGLPMRVLPATAPVVISQPSQSFFQAEQDRRRIASLAPSSPPSVSYTIPRANGSKNPSSSSIRWFKPDVHAWSPDMRQLIKSEFPKLVNQTTKYINRFDGAVTDIQAQYKNDVMVNMVLKKMDQRKYTPDNDLFGVMPSGLLALVWYEYIKKIDDPDCYTLFKENLYDMGTTCTQGDSHRLLSILTALERVKEKPECM